MSPSEKTWKQLLEQEYPHKSPPSAWTSISLLNYLAKCAFYKSKDEKSDKATRGSALHAIRAGIEAIPKDLPDEEQNALFECDNKVEEAMYISNVTSLELEAPMFNSGLRIQGTCDVIGRDQATNTLLVLDYKFGKYPVDSSAPQMKGYAACSNMPDDTRVYLGIVQPGTKLDLIATTVYECKSSVRDILLNRNYGCGTHCKWCARLDCRERDQ